MCRCGENVQVAQEQQVALLESCAGWGCLQG